MSLLSESGMMLAEGRATHCIFCSVIGFLYELLCVPIHTASTEVIITMVGHKSLQNSAQQMTFLFLRTMTIVNWCYSEGKIFFGKVFTALGNHMYFWQCLQTSLVGSVQYMPRSERLHEKTAHFPVPIPRFRKLGKADSIIWPDCRNNWCLIGSILQNCQCCSYKYCTSTKGDLSLTPWPLSSPAHVPFIVQGHSWRIEVGVLHGLHLRTAQEVVEGMESIRGPGDGLLLPRLPNGAHAWADGVQALHVVHCSWDQITCTRRKNARVSLYYSSMVLLSTLYQLNEISHS